MRIAVLNWSDRDVGGSSTYLSTVIPALHQSGHEISFWHELNEPTDRHPITMPQGLRKWSVAELGLEVALTALRAWRPDVLYCHGLLDPRVEKDTLEIAPAVLLAHNYYGTCISGTKTHTSPDVSPCSRQFGRACLIQYYPRRCGGLSPLTMMEEFQRQSSRFGLLRRYRKIVTLSTHMQREYERHGFDARKVLTAQPRSPLETVDRARPVVTNVRQEGWRLLYVGRMDALKGGRYLLDALPHLARVLRKPLQVTFVGDGPDRQSWEDQAARLAKSEALCRILFTGWVAAETVDELMAAADLLVVPSVWPEPFALVGLEAARNRLPVAAFAVGGIPEWLAPGVNGFLADGDPATPDGLAQAIVNCLQDEQTYARLREGAGRISPQLVYRQHVEALTAIFEQIVAA